MSYRKLTNNEISALKQQGCFSANWATIFVKDGFDDNAIFNTQFAGEIKLGSFRGTIELEKGISKPVGIKNSYIENCEIGDNIYIANVNSLVNYKVTNNVAIENVGTIVVNGETTFGNGYEIEVLNEGGGRDLPIFDKLSSQLAYLMVIYRHDKLFTEKLLAIINSYVESKKASKGTIGKNARILNTTSLRNVVVGEYTVISGASNLENGTIGSCKEAPTKIGEDVIAKDFIILSGSKVDSGAIITSSFIGQGVQIGKQFSSENCTFFANCEGFHGEACSVFAGPYTVTHHKSTLLIAGMFSFFNAGSGTNQSNHMYKLGPLHQGTVERGSKTGSFSYMLWPCKVGAYSVVMDKHGSNFDTSELPFSYITLEKGKSVITPAMNLFTVGTARDTVKWPKRDRRKDPNKLDLISFDFLNPFVAGKIFNGINLLNELHANVSKKQDYVMYKGISINRLMLRTSRRYYETAIHVYIGNLIVKQLNRLSAISSIEAVQKFLTPKDNRESTKWVDLLGLVAPEDAVNSITESVKSGKIDSVEGLQNRMELIHNAYEIDAYSWGAAQIKSYLGIDVSKISKDQLTKIITDWKINSLKMNTMILKDAEKEFDQNSKLGFGNDGDETVLEADFEAIRGKYETNSFVVGLKNESAEIESVFERLISQLDKLSV
jgi:hypothetical protein